MFWYLQPAHVDAYEFLVQSVEASEAEDGAEPEVSPVKRARAALQDGSA